MLRNSEIKQLLHASVLLEIISQYLIDTEDIDFYEKTKITLLDIEKSKKELIHIHSTQTLKKLEANRRSNAFNKTHKEYHKIINNIYEARKTNNQKRLEYWQNKLKEYKGGEQ